MESGSGERQWFWATLTLSSVTIAAVVFAIFELTESRFFRDVDYITLHYLYVTRGIASSLLLAFWAAWFVLHERRRSEEELRRSRERYRGLLEAFPGAVTLYDSRLIVSEWNAGAERLYGFSKPQVLGRALPIIPPEKEAELRGLLERAGAGAVVLDLETQRRDRQGQVFDVQLSLLPFYEAGTAYFLEVTADIRERVRLRQTLLEIEKLTSMGKMAAGTAHHLNTPLAALLLRVQMMRERRAADADLERLEAGIHFCQQFVQRLLDFSRRPPVSKQPEEIACTIQSVLGFLAPAVLSRRAEVSVSLDQACGGRVFADRNLLEALFSILLSNALDAIDGNGRITIQCHKPDSGSIEVHIRDNGCGVRPEDLEHIFEPFFTTKGPGKGTGLGLAIARNIVAEHGGWIRLESQPSEGATVIVGLPLWHGPGAAAKANL